MFAHNDVTGQPLLVISLWMFVISLLDIHYVDIIFIWSAQNVYCLVCLGFSEFEELKWQIVRINYYLYLSLHMVLISPLLPKRTSSVGHYSCLVYCSCLLVPVCSAAEWFWIVASCSFLLSYHHSLCCLKWQNIT